MRTADACELTLKVVAGLAMINFLVLHLWWHPHLWGLQDGLTRGVVQVLGLEELHGDKLNVQVCWGVKIKQQPADQSAVLPKADLTTLNFSKKYPFCL